MDIETLKQLIDLVSSAETKAPRAPGLCNGMINKYVIVRCRDAGVHAGILESHQGRECVLREGRRLWKHKPKASALDWFEGVAQTGLSEQSKISATVPMVHLTENCEIVLCTRDAEESIRNFP